jgi:hypothetical protein
LLLPSFFSACHTSLRIRDKTIAPSLVVSVDVPLFRSTLDLVYMVQATHQLKDIFSHFCSGRYRSLSDAAPFSYSETWIHETAFSVKTPPKRVHTKIPQHCTETFVALEVIIIPKEDLVSCTFSLTSPLSAEKEISLENLCTYFSQNLNKYTSSLSF